MARHPIFNAFLKRQFEDGLALNADSDIVSLMPLPHPDGLPTDYIARFRCQGLVKTAEEEIVPADQFDIGLRFEETHLRQVRPGFVMILDPLTVWHPNIREQGICLGYLPPAVGLVDVVQQCFSILTYQNFATADALNIEAAQWARNHLGLFPLDKRPLKRRRLNLVTTRA